MISAVTLLVRDYDEALAFFVAVMGFELVADTQLEGGKRWVQVQAPGGGSMLLLARAATPEQVDRIGDQTGGRVFLFLQTAHFWADYQRMLAGGVRFVESPRAEPYGMVVVFLDLYGNRWDLLGPNQGLASGPRKGDGEDDVSSGT